MFLLRWLTQLVRPSRQGAAPLRPLCSCPGLEPLEPRLVPNGTPWPVVAVQAAEAAYGFGPPQSVHASTVTVSAGSSIQSAVDAASPGTVIFLSPGTYQQTVTVSRPDILLVGLGGPGRVVLGNPGGADNGINVTAGADGFGLLDVSVDGFDSNGVLLDGVRRFVLGGVEASGNGQYGLFPVASGDGLIVGCTASGSNDTGIYVGQSAGVALLGNAAFGNVNGLEVENSLGVLAAGNVSVGNTVGILVDVLPGLGVPTTAGVLVADNLVAGNVHPNFAPADDIASAELAGTGILVLGASLTAVQDNWVLGNPVIGIGLLNSELLAFFGGGPVTGIEPTPIGDVVRDNTVLGAPLGADLLWDGLGLADCWSGNTFATVLAPGPLPSCSC
jgi:parallel beta-helix repeat protein